MPFSFYACGSCRTVDCTTQVDEKLVEFFFLVLYQFLNTLLTNYQTTTHTACLALARRSEIRWQVSESKRSWTLPLLLLTTTQVAYNIYGDPSFTICAKKEACKKLLLWGLREIIQWTLRMQSQMFSCALRKMEYFRITRLVIVRQPDVPYWICWQTCFGV